MSGDEAAGYGPKFVSPSRIARYFFHECDRFLRYTSTPRSARATEGVPSTPYETRPVTRAILETGYAWEERVLAEHIGPRALVAPGQGQVRERAWAVDDSVQLLGSAAGGSFIYQPTLSTPDSFYRRFGLDPARVQVSDFRPDLIEITDGSPSRALRVIDVKASPGVKLAHRIQATLYSLLLEEVVAEHVVPVPEVSDRPAIWLSGLSEPTEFDIRAIRPPLETFLRHRLQDILEQPAADAAWHLYYRCEWCEFFRHCQAEMRSVDSVSRVPYLSSHAKAFLGELDPPVHTVEELARLLAEPRADEVLEQASSLAGEADRLLAQVEALRSGSIGIHGGASLAMPRAEHVRLVLTLQREPVSGHVYGYALYGQGLGDVLGANPPTSTAVAANSTDEEIARVERTLVEELHSMMSLLHAFNERRSEDWAAQKTLQAFVFDSYEQQLLTELLVRRISDPAVAVKALQVFFYFQRPELLPAEDHPDQEVFFPVVVLTSVLRRLFALPIEVSYRFADVVRILQPSRGGFAYRDSEYWGFELSNQLRSDAIFAVWYRGRTEFVERIERELRARVWAANSVANGMREALAAYGSLFAWPPRFRLPGSEGFANALLSRLAFIARYESVTGYIALRRARMAALPQRFRSGQTLQLRYLGDDRFELDDSQRETDLEESSFPQWLLASDNEDGRLALLAYHDYQNRARAWIGKRTPMALAGIAEVIGSDDRPAQVLRLATTPSTAMPPLTVGQRYLLDRRFTDFLTGRVIEELKAIDEDLESPIPELLVNPAGALTSSSLHPDVITAAGVLAAAHGMTPSQRDAYDRFLHRGLQLVWGPPGTGKTHFLALAILCLAEAHRRAGIGLHIVVSAFTHAAIENCLRKVAALDAQLGVYEGGFPIAKLDGSRTPGAPLESLTSREAESWLNERQQAVVGGTVWAIRKALEPASVDVLVVDEASQLRVPESTIALRRLGGSGRALIAGDDRQLPPIVQAVYPESEPGEPLLHRSLFEALSRPAEAHAYRSVLLENFRMNETLCRFPREQVYVPGYRSASGEVAGRELIIERGDDPLVDAIVAPEFPLVIGILDGVRAGAENRIEAELVASVATALREGLCGADGKVYGEDAAFWREGLFVVSPHHAQINAIRRALRRKRQWSVPPFVDTVDAMQGQECDAVVTSYGVADVEYAMGEREFIYSLNRLNVAITRARCKSIVFLSRPLIEPPVPAYEDDRIAEGIAFMQGLVEFAEANGTTLEFPLPDGGTLTLHRVPMLPPAEVQS